MRSPKDSCKFLTSATIRSLAAAGKYFSTAGLNNLKEVNIGQPDALKEVNAIIDTVSLEDQILYLQWNLINSAANYLSDDFIAQDFDFYGRTMSGKKEMQPRWKRAVSTVDGSLGEAVGQMYEEKKIQVFRAGSLDWS